MPPFVSDLRSAYAVYENITASEFDISFLFAFRGDLNQIHITRSIAMARESLEDLLKRVGGPVKLLRNSQTGPYVYPVVPAEFTNWRDEQRAWQQTCVLYNQSYHMTDMYVQGQGALRLLSDLGINTFQSFEVNNAKQFIVCNYDGYVIGDVILVRLEENLFNLVGRPSVHNWVQYNGETGKYDVRFERDERAAARQGPIVRK